MARESTYHGGEQADAKGTRMGKKSRKKKRENISKASTPGTKSSGRLVQDDLSRNIKAIRKWKIAAMLLVIFAAAFSVYFNTLENDFVWDDEYLIQNNSQIKSLEHLPNVFRTYVGYGSENVNNFYRPLQELSNMLDYHFWGEDASGFHLTNTVLHSLVSVMVGVLFLFLSGSLLAASIGALFFAVHPVHTQAVAYIAGRADPLYSLFMLISITLFMSYSRSPLRPLSKGKYAFSLVFFSFAVLSKEIALVTPLLIMIYVWFFRSKSANYSRLKWSIAPFAALVGLYAYLRTTVLDFSHIAPTSVLARIPMPLRLITFFRTVFVYIGLLFSPRNLRLERTIPASTTLGEEEILAVFFMILIAWAAWFLKKKDRLLSFCVVWFFVCLIPVSNIVPINSFIAEHWIYMASLGFFLALGILSARIIRLLASYSSKVRAALTFLFASVLLAALSVYGLMTVERNKDWKDPITFFESTLRHSPRNVRLYLNMGNAYFNMGDLTRAMESYEKALEINPNYAVAYGNIGSIYLNQGRLDEAEHNFRRAISLNDNLPIVHYSLGVVYDRRRRYDDAIKELERSVELLPQHYQSWNLLGRIYARTGDYPEATRMLEKSLSIMPDQPEIAALLERYRRRI